MRNRGITRGRMFMGGLLLFAAVIAWGTAAFISPHGTATAEGPEHVRTIIVGMQSKAALITLLLCGLSAWLLFPSRRPRWPLRDWAIIAVLALLVIGSVYQLIWLQTALR